MAIYQPLTISDLQAFKAGDVFFMRHSYRQTPIRCVIQANGTSVIGKDDLVGSINFEMSVMIEKFEKAPDHYKNRFFPTADGVVDAWHQQDIKSAEAILQRSPEDTLLELYQGWRGENDRTTREEQAMLSHLEALFGIRVAYP